jgi:simple sugar transport system ATP-binding protein
MDRAKARARATEAMAAFDVQGVRGPKHRAALLSGGNAQKLVIAREFEGETRVVLAHSPSRGLDVRAGAAVHERLRAARDAGAAVILISDDLDEVLLLSDRVGVLSGGRLAAQFDAPVERAEVGRAMVSHVHH